MLLTSDNHKRFVVRSPRFKYSTVGRTTALLGLFAHDFTEGFMLGPMRVASLLLAFYAYTLDRS